MNQVNKTPVVQNQEVPLHIPGGSNVVILNDHHTPFEVVIEAVMHGTRLSHDEAHRRMREAHTKGWAVVACYASGDVAATVADKITMHARTNTRYDFYRQAQNFYSPWPLAVEVMDAGK